MKRTLLSVSISVALASTVSTQALASHRDGIDYSDSFFDEALQFGGHVGASYEYEDKVTDDYQAFGGAELKEKTKTTELFNVFYRNSIWDLSAFYAFKLADREYEAAAWSYTETEKSHKHLISLDKGFMLSNGWDSGLIYELEHTNGEIDNNVGTSGLKAITAEHSLRPYLTYWNNNNSWGFYSNLEYLYTDEDKNAWGSTEEEGYSILFKPYKRIGNWELGVEFFYQIKDTKGFSADGTLSDKTDFTEKYFEPIVQYSFEDAGTLYTRVRIGENETKDMYGLAEGETYFKDIRKATIGYEQTVGDNWLLKAEYEWAKDEETFTMNPGDKKEVEQDTFYVQALYRF